MARAARLVRCESTAAKNVSGEGGSAMQRAMPILFNAEDLARFGDLLREPVAVHDVPVHEYAPTEAVPYATSVAVYNESERRFFPAPPPSVQGEYS